MIVAIVTGFDSDAHESIPAACRHTIASTAVSVVEITVITAFKASPDHPIAATGEPTVLKAVITIVFVTIVAFFLTAPNHTIATNCILATIAAGVVLLVVAVITGFAQLDFAIATRLDLAILTTAISTHVVAIVTSFELRLSCFDIDPEIAIATPGRNATVEAGVSINSVPIITALEPTSDHAVATASGMTVVQTRVTVVLVTVIAVLTSLYESVATMGNLTVV